MQMTIYESEWKQPTLLSTGPKKMMQMELLKLTVPINMPMGTMSKSPKKVADELGKKPLIVKNILERFNSSPHFW